MTLTQVYHACIPHNIHVFSLCFSKDKLTTIVVRTVALLRPYYSWKMNVKEEISKEKEEETKIEEKDYQKTNTHAKADNSCTAEVFEGPESMKNVVAVFSDLLMRKLSCASVVEKYSQSKEGEQECWNSRSTVEVLCGILNLADIACLLVAQ